MKIVGRILAIVIIVTSLLSIVLALVSVVGIWRASGPLIQSLDTLAGVTVTGLDTANDTLQAVDSLLSLLEGAMQDVQKNAEQLKADIENSNPIIDVMSGLLDEDVGPKIEQTRQMFQGLHESVQDIDAVIQTVNTLPFVSIPEIAQATGELVKFFDEIAMTVDDLDEEVEEIKGGVTELVIQPIQDQAEQVEEDLGELQDDVREIQRNVETAYQITVEVKPRIPQIVRLFALLLTVQLLWNVVAQAALIYLSWLYLKTGRLDLHRSLPEGVEGGGSAQ